MKKDNKVAEFQIDDILPIALTLVVTGIGISFGLNVIADVRDDLTVNTAEYNASQDAITGIAKIPAKLPIISTVVVAAIIIGILLRFLLFQRK